MGKIITIIPVESISGKLGGKDAPIGFAKRQFKNKVGDKVNYTCKYGKRSTTPRKHEMDIRELFKKRIAVRKAALEDVHRFDWLQAKWRKSGVPSFNGYIWDWLKAEVTFENYKEYQYSEME